MIASATASNPRLTSLRIERDVTAFRISSPNSWPHRRRARAERVAGGRAVRMAWIHGSWRPTRGILAGGDARRDPGPGRAVRGGRRDGRRGRRRARASGERLPGLLADALRAAGEALAPGGVLAAPARMARATPGI